MAALIFSVVLVLAGAVALLWLWGWWPQAALAQGPVGTAFTYQGQLKQGSTPVNGPCDFQFSLWDAASGGNPVGITQTHSISVTNGLFTVNDLDFGGDAFSGDARWLQIEVRCPAGSGSYTLLDPPQELTPAPYALYARSTGALQGRPISTTAPTADQVLTWDGGTWAPANVKGSPYANVIVVAKSGGDYTSIQAALDSISDNSDSNRYLVWVAPGTYTERVTMKPYVDIEGAGELVTKITHAGSSSAYTGTVIGANDAELRFLTVESTGGSRATAIYNSSTSPRLTHVTATASGGSLNNSGVRNRSSSPTMTHVTASGSGGTHNWGVDNLESSSPTMTHVTATGSGGDWSYGVRNGSSSPTMTDVTATASGGNDSYGVYNNSSSPTMSDVTATASGGNDSYGVYNNSSSPTMTDVTATASGGSYNYGIRNFASSGTYTVTVNHCQVTGSTSTIESDGEFTTLVAASLLDGGPVSVVGTTTCAGVYDENYTFYPSTCP